MCRGAAGCNLWWCLPLWLHILMLPLHAEHGAAQLAASTAYLEHENKALLLLVTVAAHHKLVQG